MFVGHFAVAFAARRAEPRLPLWSLVAAACGLDLLWPVFLLLGVETVRIAPGITPFTPLDFTSYPWSHSLLMSLVWGAIAGHVARMRLHSVRAGLIIGAAVVSHWVLDFASHRPDMPLWPYGPRVGLGLWYSITWTFIVEGALFAAGLVLYQRATRPRDAQGRWAFWAFAVVITAIWASGPFGSPPPSVRLLAIVGLAGAVLLVLWSAWFDRHRVVETDAQRPSGSRS